VRPGRSPETLVNGASMLRGRLTRQALMQLARSAVKPLQSSSHLAADSLMGNRLAR